MWAARRFLSTRLPDQLRTGSSRSSMSSFSRILCAESKPPQPPTPPPSSEAAKGAARAAAANAAQETAPKRDVKGGPISWQSFALTMLTGAGLVGAYEYLKESKKKDIKGDRSIGEAAIGGPFKLIGEKGQTVTSEDYLGHWVLLYFGFTHCPDICPDELIKVGEAVDMVEKANGVCLHPIFISIDPERDTVAQVSSYVKEFHPRMVGLTGSKEATEAAAKAYRVYHTRANVVSESDYLIDHSIITYMLDPQGKFLKFYGKNVNAEEMATSMMELMAQWRPRK